MPQHPSNPEGNSGPQRAPQTMTDEQVMLGVQRGDGHAFTILFDRYHRLVLVTALKILHDAGEAEEVTQSVFFEIYRAAGKFDPSKGTLKVWLLQYAYHRSINRRNYLLLRQFYNQADFEETQSMEPAARPVSRLQVQELAVVIQQAMATLSGAQRRTIQKVFFEGMTLKEVAEQRGESFSSVRNHYYRGLDRLRSCLELPAALRESTTTVSFLGVSRVKA